MTSIDPLGGLRTHLQQIEDAISTGSWDGVTESWSPPAASLSADELEEAAALLRRIEEAREEVSRLESESAELRSQIDHLRRAGRAYVTNDALL